VAHGPGLRCREAGGMQIEHAGGASTPQQSMRNTIDASDCAPARLMSDVGSEGARTGESGRIQVDRARGASGPQKGVRNTFRIYAVSDLPLAGNTRGDRSRKPRRMEIDEAISATGPQQRMTGPAYLLPVP